ncbi:hypothetical protein [Phytohabitans suffuscus]|uniref:DUF1579 domain-containing protein n=1 Tax=Phytohabitans suffuscus TaxID=624315 RepID=A0A6F8Z0D9_9ACTN|nr:hypothetical protein [Phytohabitans suffuscus]BCB91713.1 hypothetical protein Psuf_090260 [Phytohabitans suffuscus]
MTDDDRPPDVPDERPAWLDHLDVLVGAWDTMATFDAGFLGPGTPATAAAGRTTFEWLDGRRFLVQRVDNEHPDFPRALTVVGAGAEPDTFTQRYYDSRGVERVYGMGFDGRRWRLWRESPGFWQRYTGVLSGDGRTITGAWEASADGREWRHDFGLTHTRAAY